MPDAKLSYNQLRQLETVTGVKLKRPPKANKTSQVIHGAAPFRRNITTGVQPSVNRKLGDCGAEEDSRIARRFIGGLAVAAMLCAGGGIVSVALELRNDSGPTPTEEPVPQPPIVAATTIHTEVPFAFEPGLAAQPTLPG